MLVSTNIPRARPAVLLLALAIVNLQGLIILRAQNLTGNQKGNKAMYPPARKSDQTDNYHGVKVSDPYRWLEDLDSAETRSWVEAENTLAFGYLKEIPAVEKIKTRLTKLWNYERFGVPFKEGNRYFYTRNTGLQNQGVLYTVASLADEPKMLLDPNTLSADGTVALSGLEISHDGKWLAYSLSASGSDWQEWKVRDVATGLDTADDLKWVKFSGASWTPDSKGFFYSRYDEPKEDSLKGTNYFQKLYYHRLGTPQAADRLVYQSPDQKEWLFAGTMTDDGRYLIINISEGTDVKNRVYYQDLAFSDKQPATVKLLDGFDAAYNFIDNDGTMFWFQTNLDAPRGKIIGIDITRPERKNWKVIVPEAAETLQGVTFVNHTFVTDYLKDAHAQFKIYDRDGRLLREVQFPGIGAVSGFAGKAKDKETFYAYTSFTTPTTIYRYDLVTGKSSIFRQPKVDFNANDYETRQVFYNSKDGTRVPMFITHKKGLPLDGSNPTYLYGYGGFDISLTPAFSVGNLVWMELGGVYAQPSLRGGGEYGED